MKGRATRRGKWTTRTWRRSRRGGFFVNTLGLVASISAAGDRWRAGGGPREGHAGWKWAHGSYATVEEAQLAIFDVLWPSRVSV
jgi:hypothetical protein